MIRMAKDIWCCCSNRTVHCDTSEAAQQRRPASSALQDQLKLFNRWGLLLCVCVVHSDQNEITFDWVCEYCYIYICVLSLFPAAEQSSTCIKKEKYVRKYISVYLFFFFFSPPQLAIPEEEQLVFVLSKISQCAWIFLKKLCWLIIFNSFFLITVIISAFSFVFLWIFVMGFLTDVCYT